MRLGLVLLFGALAACGSSPSTSIELDVSYDPAWNLTGFAVDAHDATIGGTPHATDDGVSRKVLLLVPDDWAGHTVHVDLDGMRGSIRAAAGSIEVTPMLDQMTPASIALTKLACGASCTAGATECAAGGVAAGATGDDGCMAWSAPTACPGGTQCSLGVCSSTCVAECASGETRCDGADAVRACGQADGDACLDWLPAEPCGAGQTCSAGRCTAVCVDECTTGATECAAGGTMMCADHDADGCLDWGPVVPCAAGQSCSNGTCGVTCTDECSASGCAEDAYRQCGQYDFDPCLDWSPGSSCVPADPCQTGSCSAAGCASTAKVCDAPPPPTCADAGTLRTYAGACGADGDCHYAPSDTTCPQGCSGGACTGPFTCDDDSTIEPNDSLATAYTLSVPFPLDHIDLTNLAICPDGDVDLYALTVILPVPTIDVSVRFDSNGAPLQVWVLDPNGTPIGTNTISSTITTAHADNLTTGTYYVRVTSQQATGKNNYSMSVSSTGTTSGTSVTLSETTSNAIVASNSISCNQSGAPRDNSYYRAFVLADYGITGPFTIQHIDFGVEQSTCANGVSQTVDVNVYTYTGAVGGTTLDTSHMNLVIGAEATVGQGATSAAASGGGVIVPAGSVLVAEVHSADSQVSGNTFFIGSNASGQTRPSYIRASACSITVPTSIATVAPGNTDDILLTVTGTK